MVNVALAAKSAGMAVPPVAWVNCAALTVMAGLVLEGFVPSETLVAVRVKLPVLLKETSGLCVPLASAALGGRVALESLEVIPTVSVTLVTTFQKTSTALTVTLKAVNSVCALAVPVLPVAPPGEAVSPGTRSCNFAKAADPTATGSERTLVNPELVKLTVMVLATL